MFSALVLGRSPRVADAVAACRAARISACMPGRFPNGIKVVVILDLDSFHALLRANGGPSAFRENCELPVVVLTEDSVPAKVMRAIVEAGAIQVSPGETDLLPVLLDRLLWMGDGPGHGDHESGVLAPGPVPADDRPAGERAAGTEGSDAPEDEGLLVVTGRLRVRRRALG